MTTTRVIVARKASTCTLCGGPILAGVTRIRQDSVGAWVHDACPEGGDDFSFDDDAPAADLDMGAVYARVDSAVAAARQTLTASLTGTVDAMTRGAFTREMPGVVQSIRATVLSALTNELGKQVGTAVASLKREVRAEIAKLALEGSATVRHEFVLPERTTTLEGEILHPGSERAVRLALAGKPIFLPGPAGCGKTTLGMQIAKVLGREFGMVSCSPGMTESALTGRAIPKITTGEEVFRSTEFVRCYEEGGVFLFDEVDAADPSVLLVINSALANGRLALPNRAERPYAKRHPEFVCVAAANTWGRGADRQYVGRSALDGAFLDRFKIGTIACDYVEAIERAVCPDPELYDLFTGWREKIRAARLERTMTTRNMRDAYDMLQCGDTLQDIKDAFFGGWRAEEVAKVLGA